MDTAAPQGTRAIPMHSIHLRQQVGHTSSQPNPAQLAHASTGIQEQDQFLQQPAVQLASPPQEVSGRFLILQHWCLHMGRLVLAVRGHVLLAALHVGTHVFTRTILLGCVPFVSVSAPIRQACSEMCSQV